jgi:AbrB family looped-hinge helix DNA binding protein
MVTFNGRITIPPQVRKNLGLKTGDNVEFVEIEQGRFAICPRNRSAIGHERRIPKPDFALDKIGEALA